jgi:hypothetical protein
MPPTTRPVYNWKDRGLQHMKELVFDFQEAQCFFIIITQTVSLVAIGNGAGGKAIAATNGWQLLANGHYLALTAQVGCFVSLFVVGMLWLCDSSSLYIILLTCISVVISQTLAFTVNHNTPSTFNRALATSISPTTRSHASCGFLPPPNIYCGTLPGNPNGAIITLDTILSQIAFWMAFALLFPAALGLVDFTIGYTYTKSGKHRKYSLIPDGLFLDIFIVVIVLSSMILSVGLFYSLFHVHRLGFISNDWQIGQFVAVTIWVPTASRFLYCLRRKCPIFKLRRWD